MMWIHLNVFWITKYGWAIEFIWYAVDTCILALPIVVLIKFEDQPIWGDYLREAIQQCRGWNKKSFIGYVEEYVEMNDWTYTKMQKSFSIASLLSALKKRSAEKGCYST
jgi:hypothetical protein